MALAPKLATAVYKRDGWKCRYCQNRNGLHPHHVIYKSQQGPDTLNNLLTLCWQCHRAHHDGHLGIIVREVLANDLVVQFIRKGNWKPQ